MANHVSPPERSTKTFIEGPVYESDFWSGWWPKDHGAIHHREYLRPCRNPNIAKIWNLTPISPMCIKLKDDDNRTHYLSPSDVRTPYLIFNGLIDRYKTFYHEQPPFSASDCTLEVTREPKSALITVKAGTPNQTRVRGYTCAVSRWKLPWKSWSWFTHPALAP